MKLVRRVSNYIKGLCLFYLYVIMIFWEYLLTVECCNVYESESEVTQSCPTLCDPMDCGLPGSSLHGILQARVLGVGCHFLLQRIFPTQGLNPGLPHWRQTLYHLSHQGILFGCLDSFKWRINSYFR